MTQNTFDPGLTGAHHDQSWSSSHDEFVHAAEEYRGAMWVGRTYECEQSPCGECLACVTGESASCAGCGQCWACGVEHAYQVLTALAADKELLINARRVRARRDQIAASQEVS